MTQTVTDEPITLEGLQEVDTSYPVLQPGLVELSIAEAARKVNNAGTGENLVVKFKLETPAKTVTGKDVNPGFTLTDWIPLLDQEGKQASASYASFQECFLGKREQGLRPSQLVGLKATVKVRTDKDKETDTLRNRFTYIPKRAAA